MTLVVAETGEIVACSPDEAREITDRIRNVTSDLWALLAEAHDRQAWRALGYESFKAYVHAEFAMSKRHAYRLLDQAAVIGALTEAAGVTHGSLDISEREARELKPHLDEVAKNVADATVDTDPELKAEAAREAIEQTRQAIKDAEKSDEDKRPPITKPDLDGNGLSHPARFSKDLLPVFADLLTRYIGEGTATVLDPFAGAGGIHQLEDYGWQTVGVELEPEWAKLHDRTEVGSALDLPFDAKSFGAVVTSPTYGNRLADNHDAKDPHLRRSYKHDLGRDLTDGNSGAMQWGPEYRTFHKAAWEQVARVLRPGGVFLLNISDHIRNGKREDVSGWHVRYLLDAGFTFLDCVPVATGRLRQGANAEARVDAELVWAFRRD